MTTLQILWNTTWRGAVWLTVAGVVSGAAYGLLMLAMMIFSSNGGSSPGIAGVCFVVGIAAGIGALAGGATGLIVGVADGLLVGALLRWSYFAGSNGEELARSVGLICAIASPLWVFLAYSLFLAHGLTPGILPFVLIPMVAAVFCGRWAGMRLARWFDYDYRRPAESR